MEGLLGKAWPVCQMFLGVSKKEDLQFHLPASRGTAAARTPPPSQQTGFSLLFPQGWQTPGR